MPAPFSDTSLFGGAITVRLPANFIDASNLRQVPDNQEVYVNGEGVESIVIDIMERVEGIVDGGRDITTDLDALKYHVEDIVEQSPNISSVSTIAVPHLPPGTPCMTCFVNVPAATGNTYTGILLLLMRLKERKTDLVIALNLPNLSVAEDAHVADQLSSQFQDARVAMDEVVSSFEIKDWGLFL